MASILVLALFSLAAVTAFATIVLTVAPYKARIICLLTHGTQSRLVDLPPLPARRGERATPRLTASPAHLRAAA